MNDSIEYFFNWLDNPPKDIGRFLLEHKDVVWQKGYGTPELEIKYMHKVFLHIQKSHPEFVSFSWDQCNAYNDNYYNFELRTYEVNDMLYINSSLDTNPDNFENKEITSEISFEAIDYHDPDEKEFAIRNKIQKENDGLPVNHRESYQEFNKTKYKSLEIPCLKFLAFIKLLEMNYSAYFFLYTFGNGVEIRFDKEGVTVKKVNEKDIDGSPLGEGMDLKE